MKQFHHEYDESLKCSLLFIASFGFVTITSKHVIETPKAKYTPRVLSYFSKKIARSGSE
jgi:hypothetical protein